MNKLDVIQTLKRLNEVGCAVPSQKRELSVSLGPKFFIGLNLMASPDLFKWRHFLPKIILLNVRWYCRYALSYRDLEEMMAERGVEVGIEVRFLGKTCRDCPMRSLCMTSKSQPRELTFRPQKLFVALNERRSLQNTKAFQQQSGARAGIESAHSQGVRRMGLRRTGYIGLAKTHLQHVFIAIALNLIHLDAWFNGVPLAKTRVSRFKRELQSLAV